MILCWYTIHLYKFEAFNPLNLLMHAHKDPTLFSGMHLRCEKVTASGIALLKVFEIGQVGGIKRQFGGNIYWYITVGGWMDHVVNPCLTWLSGLLQHAQCVCLFHGKNGKILLSNGRLLLDHLGTKTNVEIGNDSRCWSATD